MAGQTTQHDYDEFGNLTHVGLPNGTQVHYLIDGMQRRVGKKRNGVFERGWLYKNPTNPVAAFNAAGQIVQAYVYGESRQAPAYIIDVQALRYDVWGVVIEDSNPGFEPFGFAGGLVDVDTGLVRFGARDDKPGIGRSTRKDLILPQFAGHPDKRFASQSEVNKMAT